jgi:hypothetical protein
MQLTRKLLLCNMINKWLVKTIIGLDLCPFTRRPYLEGKVLIEELSGQDCAQAQNQFLSSLSFFQGQAQFETVLLAYPEWKVSFEAFYDFLADCEEHLISLNLQDEFQLVAFHPDFCFDGLKFSNRANLVNSSPLALIHILKIQDLELLNLSMQEAKAMSFGNAKKLEALSDEQLNDHFPWRAI